MPGRARGALRRLLLRLWAAAVRACVRGFRAPEDCSPLVSREGEFPIVIANHRSNLDSLMILMCLYKAMGAASCDYVFVADKSFWLLAPFVPVGLVLVDRSRRTLEPEARRKLEAARGVLVFPEGTRSRDGRLKPLKRGAVELARAAALERGLRPRLCCVALDYSRSGIIEDTLGFGASAYYGVAYLLWRGLVRAPRISLLDGRDLDLGSPEVARFLSCPPHGDGGADEARAAR